jgi:hypothetical protein
MASFLLTGTKLIEYVGELKVISYVMRDDEIPIEA